MTGTTQEYLFAFVFEASAHYTSIGFLEIEDQVVSCWQVPKRPMSASPQIPVRYINGSAAFLDGRIL